jgi:predicted amidohydrolase
MRPRENFSRAHAFIKQAASAGADLAVLPEYFLTNWVPDDSGFADFAEDREYLAKFCVCIYIYCTYPPYRAS